MLWVETQILNQAEMNKYYLLLLLARKRSTLAAHGHTTTVSAAPPGLAVSWDPRNACTSHHHHNYQPTNQQRQSPEDVERLPKRVPTGVQNSLWRKTDVISIVIFHITFRAEIKQKRQKNNQHPSTESRKIKTETITLSGYPTRGKQNVCLPPLTLEYV